MERYSVRFADEVRRERYRSDLAHDPLDRPTRTSDEERRRPGAPWYNHPFRQRRDYTTAHGPYSGLGPRNYRRSNEALLDEVCSRLTQHGQIDARQINVKVDQGVVTLEGSVPDRRTKRLAEDVAETVIGITDINNHLRVK